MGGVLGQDKASRNDLTLVKPHTITTTSFQKPLASEVPLTSHMLKVAKLSKEPEQSLIPPSGEVNANDTADKSLSRASVVILLKKQVTETRHAEVTVATADATKSLVAFELTEEQGNQPSATEAEKVLDQNIKEDVKDTEFVGMEEVTFKQIMDEVDAKTQGAQEITESPYDTESEIKIINSYQVATISGSLFIHQSSSYNQDKDAKEEDASDSRWPKSDTFGYLQEELNSLNNKADQLKSSISKKVADIQSSILTIVTYTLEAKMLGLLSEALKISFLNCFVQKNLQAQLPDILLKPMYKEFNAFNKLMEQPLAQDVPNEDKALVVHNPEEKKSEGTVSMEDDSDDDDLDKQPLSKRFKIMTSILNPIPLNTFVPEHLLKPEEQQKSLHEFID
uniref:Uncharacterized protein n=1 Tax=Tanacetum cinerariifolium TaxID=118510 RepID=A0A6L2LCK5_TANCI|nr:hypothetical protein [Tanacetum cinerariifolium]